MQSNKTEGAPCNIFPTPQIVHTGSERLGRLVPSADVRPPSQDLGVSSDMDCHLPLYCTQTPLTGMSLCQTRTLLTWTLTLPNYTKWFPTRNPSSDESYFAHICIHEG